MTPPLVLSTLGELLLRAGDSELLPGRRMELVLLAYLARHPSPPVQRAELAALLWGEREEHRARTSLRQALHKLRQALGSGIDITSDTVALVDESVLLDVSEMEADLAAGRLEAAVDRWKGTFLPGAEEIGSESLRVWVETERASLQRRMQTTLDQLVTAAEQRGDWSGAVGWAKQWAEGDPLSEPAHTRWIGALRLAGHADEAMAVHAAFTARFQRELDAEPSPGFKVLAEQSAHAATTAPRRRLASSSAALFTPDMVGRSAVFGNLVAAWEAVREGAGTVVVIEGDEGIGKTRLCEEFLRWIEAAGSECFLLHARAYAAERDRPWAAARGLLEPLGSAPGLGGAPDEALAVVSRLAPSIRERFPRLPDSTASDSSVEDSLARVLADVAAEVPIVLFLEDFPVADPATQHLLAVLALHPPARVLILLTARTGTSEADAALPALREFPHLHRHALRPLSQPEVEALIASMFVLEPDDRHALATRLHAGTAGNPLYTVALVSALADTGHLAPDETGTWRLAPGLLDGPLPLPAGVRDTVRARLDLLGNDARHVAGAAATLGFPIDATLLEAVAGLPAEAFAEAVEELVARRMLREVPPPGHGYRFTHDVIGRVTYELLSRPRRQALHRRALAALSRNQGDDDEAAAATRYHRERAGLRAQPTRHRRMVLTTICVAVVAAVIAAMSLWRGAKAPASASAAHDARPSLAVLYLENLSGDTLDAYLAEGFTEEIASRLGALERLRVKSPRAALRFQGDSARLDPIAIGDTLDVDYLVEGSVRRSGERLRIAVRLTSTADGFQIWNDAFDAATTELLDVQDTISKQIATRIAGQLVPEEQIALSQRATDNPQAYDHFLRGNYHLARRTPASVLRAIEEYRQAARLDPNFSGARAREAYGYAIFLDWGWTYPGTSDQELLARGLLITERILQRDSASADAWMARGHLFVIRDPVRHAGAVEAFQRSIALNPNNAEVHHQLGQSLTALGRWDEAIAAYRRALEIEPGRAMTLVPIAAIRLRQGRTEEALRLRDSAVIGDPSVSYAYASRAFDRLNASDPAGARDDAETALQLDQSYQVPARSMLAAARYRLGDTAAAQQELEKAARALGDPSRPTPSEAVYLTAALIALERPDDALDLMERMRPLSAWVWFYFQNPIFDEIRDHPRFQQIFEQVRPLDR